MMRLISGKIRIMKLKSLLFAVVLVICIHIASAYKIGYDFDGISVYLINLAKHKGVHGKIITKAYKLKIRQDDFKDFYRNNAVNKINKLNLPYTNASKEIDSNPNKALKKYKQLLASCPNNAQNHFFLGLTYEKLYLYDKALESYHKSLGLDDDGYDGIIYTKIAEINASLGFYENAILNFIKSLRVVGGNTASILRLSDLYFETGDYKNSANNLRTFFELSDPDSETAKKQSIGIVCEVLSYHGYPVKGCVKFEKYYGDFLKNVYPPLEKQIFELEYSLLKKAKQLDIETSKELARLYGEYAYRESMLKTGYPYIVLKKAISLKTKQVSLNPTADAYGQRAILKYRLASFRGVNFMSAVSDFMHAVRMCDYKEKIPYLLFLFDIYLKYRLYEKALAKLEYAISLDPSNPHLYYLGAYLGIKENNYSKAKINLKKYFDLEKNKTSTEKTAGAVVCKMFVLYGEKLSGCHSRDYYYRNLFSPPVIIISENEILKLQKGRFKE